MSLRSSARLHPVRSRLSPFWVQLAKGAFHCSTRQHHEPDAKGRLAAHRASWSKQGQGGGAYFFSGAQELDMMMP